jgi:ABC-type Fe3+/spermidine/putrescine transport system ATPase subunit
MVLLGPSGSGKTTLLRCVAGIERLSSGRIAIGGERIADDQRHTPPERRDLSMVFQDYALWPHLTALENVRFALRRRRLPILEANQRAAEMLERVGLGGHPGKYPNELSGGEQQRVGLARALVAQTGLLLFDEPLSNLDANLREHLRVEIATLAREADATSIYITHDQVEAFALADVVGVLGAGRLLQLGSPQDIYSRPATPFVARFTGLAGECRVTVVDSRGDQPTVKMIGDASVKVRALTLPRDGEPGQLYVRPSAIHFGSVSTPGAILARIADVAFRGRGYDHAIVLGDGTTFVGIHDEQARSRGDEVAVSFDPAGCFYFGLAAEDPMT